MQLLVRQKDLCTSASLVRLGLLLAATVPVYSQAAESAGESSTADAQASIDEVVVTARRRDETLLSVPVAVSVVTKGDLARRALTGLDGLVQMVPQLMISEAGNNAQGGVVVIRGIGVGESNPFADQAVSFNVDGIQVARGNVRRMAETDMQQVEVLKGPQALFFGKNSPGGIIVIRTADPGDEPEAGFNTSYEFEGDEYRLDGHVSAPLSDTLGVRLSAYGSDMEGYFRNVIPSDPLTGPFRRRLPSEQNYGGRLTVKFKPSDSFDARLKVSYGDVDSSGSDGIIQTIDCPRGFSQSSLADDCSADEHLVLADPGPNIAAFRPEFREHSYLKQDQTLAGLEMNFRPNDVLTITSLTGYFETAADFAVSFTAADLSNPGFVGESAQHFGAEEVTQELRLSSSFAGPLNFMVGGFYQDSKLDFWQVVARNPVTPQTLIPRTTMFQDGEAYSLFGQATYNLIETLELSAGGRYSEEKKHFSYIDAAGNPGVTAKPRDQWDNFSPEVSLTWRPSTQFTMYGSYKRGFLSGGFNAGTGALTGDRSYDQQTTRGFEVGAKARLLGGRLHTNLAAYTYDTLGLQTNANIVANGFITQVVQNAGKSQSRGAELDAIYQAFDALSLRGAVAYNHSRYEVFSASCYAGQTIAQGCDALPNNSGVFTGQDLAGEPVLRAPDWSIQAGFTYSYQMAGARKLTLSSDANYSSGFFGLATNKPGGWQPDETLVDANLSYIDDARRFAISLIGKNLTNRYIYYRTVDAVFTGSGTGTNLATALPSDTTGAVNRGRQVMLRLSVSFE